MLYRRRGSNIPRYNLIYSLLYKKCIVECNNIVDVYNKINNMIGIYNILHTAQCNKSYCVENIQIFRFFFFLLHFTPRVTNAVSLKSKYRVACGNNTITPYIRMTCWKWEYHCSITLLNICPKASSPRGIASRNRKSRGTTIRCKSIYIYIYIMGNPKTFFCPQ
jgi:hypothetical protein